MPRIRTLLILGRVSNLPTVWSNCLAGWWLGGSGNPDKLPLLLAGATLLYLAGMYLNDAFDAKFDSEYRRERPIPCGAIGERDVWTMGLVLMAAGGTCLFMLGILTGIMGSLLMLCIVIYDAVHKNVKSAPVLMAACRFFLYLTAASTGVLGVTGWAIWCGLALALYIIGLSFLASRESTGGALAYWPCALLATPIVLAIVMNANEYLKTAALLSVALALWIARSLRNAFSATSRNVGKAVSGLLAGIVLVDLIAIADAVKPVNEMPDAFQPFGLAFIGLFLLALLTQRFVPAT